MRLIDNKEALELRLIDEEENTLAWINYIDRREDVIELAHTTVSKGQEGKGIGREIILKTIDHARKHGLRLYPTCEFAIVVLNRMEGVEDVVLSNI